MHSARDNPFRSDRIDQLAYQLEGESWEAILARLAGMNFRAAVVGPHGSGKTTFLDALTPRLSSQGLRPVRITLNASLRRLSPEQWDCLDAITNHQVLLLDGSEQLSWWGWRCLCLRTRCAGGVVITSHRAGRLPTLLKCRSSVRLAKKLVDGLCPGAIGDEAISVCFDRHAGNVREMFRELYESVGARSAEPPGRFFIDRQ